MRREMFVASVLATLSVGLISADVWAQRPGGPPRPGANRQGGSRGRFALDQLLERHDKNKDGKVTREEWQGPEQVFGQMDQNDDGVITKEEFEARMRDRAGSGGPGGFRGGPDGFRGSPGGFRGGPGGFDGRPQPQDGTPSTDAGSLLKLLDANRDGNISKEELGKFFERADSDSSDSLSEEELKKMLTSLSSSAANSRMARFQNFPQTKPALGQPAPQFELRSLEGEVHSLAELLKTKPVVIEFGSFT